DRVIGPERRRFTTSGAVFQGATFVMVLGATASSGGFNPRKDLYRSKSYATFAAPPTNRGAEKERTCINNPAAPDPTAQNRLRARFVMPLAKVRSLGLTSAAT